MRRSTESEEEGCRVNVRVDPCKHSMGLNVCGFRMRIRRRAEALAAVRFGSQRIRRGILTLRLSTNSTTPKKKKTTRDKRPKRRKKKANNKRNELKRMWQFQRHGTKREKESNEYFRCSLNVFCGSRSSWLSYTCQNLLPKRYVLLYSSAFGSWRLHKRFSSEWFLLIPKGVHI